MIPFCKLMSQEKDEVKKRRIDDAISRCEAAIFGMDGPVSGFHPQGGTPYGHKSSPLVHEIQRIHVYL